MGSAVAAGPQSVPCFDGRVNATSPSIPDAGRLVAMRQAMHGHALCGVAPASVGTTVEPQRGRTLSPGPVATDCRAAAMVATRKTEAPPGSNLMRGLSHVV